MAVKREEVHVCTALGIHQCTRTCAEPPGWPAGRPDTFTLLKGHTRSAPERKTRCVTRSAHSRTQAARQNGLREQM